ncbi:MAG: nickel pincer cofactor biosynthesis protein LarC [Deltaproteobacteria bacterium]|nr:nickel pincer cofactor biosynthesis protein LarC [Deltaproteobacteria bacterium]
MSYILGQGECGVMLRIDPIGGVSGDMFLGAFLDLGLPPEILRRNLAEIGLGERFGMSLAEVSRHGIRAVKVDFPDLPGARSHPAPKDLSGVCALLEGSGLPEPVRSMSIGIFHLLAQAEARVHGKNPAQVHFHEVGNYDTLADIVGAATALEWLRPERVAARPVPLGAGFVDCAHGRLPLPVPATAVLLEDLEVEQTDIAAELATPTGAAIYRYLRENFAPLEDADFRLLESGYGAGSRELAARPNLLRLFCGRIMETRPVPEKNLSPEVFRRETVAVLVTLIDDLSPEKFAGLAERLRVAGALEVCSRPTQMKKGRLGMELEIICRPKQETELVELLFTRSPTLGIRRRLEERYLLEREQHLFTTSFGEIRGKLARDLGGRVMNFKLESDDIESLAEKHGLSSARIEALLLAEIDKSAYKITPFPVARPSGSSGSVRKMNPHRGKDFREGAKPRKGEK